MPSVAFFTIFKIIDPSLDIVQFSVDPRVIPDGRVPTATLHGVLVKPRYPTNDISINISLMTCPSYVHGIFCDSFPRDILKAGSPGFP